MTPHILLELSYFDLEGRTNSIMGPNRKTDSSKVNVKNMIFIPMVANGDLKIIADTTSNNGNSYKTSILFDNIVYLDEPSQFSYNFEANDGSEYNIDRVTKSSNIKVNCSCLDFYYRFAVWDNKFKSLDGDVPPPYVRKTNNRPEVNPMKTPGLCKHIIAVMNDLRSQNFFK